MHRLLPIFLLISSFYSTAVHGQKTAELGVMLGRSYYLGEVNPKTHWGNGVGSFSYGALLRYNLNERYSLKLGLAPASIRDWII